MKTVGFAILVLKIREFITSKTCMKKWMQKKSVARMSRFFEKPRNALQYAIWSIWRCIGSPRSIRNGSLTMFFTQRSGQRRSFDCYMNWWKMKLMRTDHFSERSSMTSLCTIEKWFWKVQEVLAPWWESKEIPQSQRCDSEWIGSKSQMGLKSVTMYCMRPNQIRGCTTRSQHTWWVGILNHNS